MAIIKEGDAKSMPSSSLFELLDRASMEVQHTIARRGGDTPTTGDYIYFYGLLAVEAWQYRSEQQYRVTYDTVSDMIVGLQQNLQRLGNAECSVNLSPMVDGRARPAGGGTINFIGPRSELSLNGIMSGFLNTTNQTATDLGVDQWDYDVPNSDTMIRIKKARVGRTMPVAESLQLLHIATRDLHSLIEAHGADAFPEGGNYHLVYRNLHLEVHDSNPSGPSRLPYSVIQDTVTGLKDCFWRVNYVESLLYVWRIERASYVAAGHGAIFGPIIPPPTLSGGSPGLQLPGQSNTTTDGLQ